MKAHPHNIIVAGSPGAWTNAIAQSLARQGWAITWPGQVLDAYEGQPFLTNNAQNIEMHRIHQQLCERHGVSLVHSRLPHFYQEVYPGPAEYLEQFGKQPVVLSSISLPPFLDLWAGASNVVIDIQATEAEDLAMLNQLSDRTYDTMYLKAVRLHHLARYTRHLKLFAKVFTVTNAEVKDNHLTGLTRFLNSAF